MFGYIARSPASWKTSVFQLAVLILFCEAALAAIPNQDRQLLQFTADGHELEFSTEGLFAVVGDHVFEIRFAGTSGTKPRIENARNHNSLESSLTAVTYSSLWPGIDLQYSSTTKGIAASTWEIAAGADVEQIQLLYNGPVSVDNGGNLRIAFKKGWMQESAPIAWQIVDGRRRSVEVAFRLSESPDSTQIVGFEVGSYDHSRSLVIDPVLAWHTNLGSSDYDYGRAMALDSDGNVYIVGNSYANWGEPITPHAGDTDAFVAKLDTNGTLLWNTFFGSSTDDYGFSVALGDDDEVLVAGYSYNSWGTPVNAHAGHYDAFVTRLNSRGERLWHTFLGTTDYDVGFAVAVDRDNNVYVAGDSNENWGNALNAHSGGVDAFIAKLDIDGTLLWNTFIGSPGTDSGRAIAIDDSSNIYLTGYGNATWGDPKNAFMGSTDTVVAKLNENGAQVWHTFLGSRGSDHGYALALDGDRNIYIAGESDASWGNTPVNSYTGEIDAFAAKLNAEGERLWNTFMGSSDYDSSSAIAVDERGDIYVAGESNATWGDPDTPHAVDYDAFTAKLNNRGARLWSTFLGAAISDSGVAVAVDNSGIYLAGTSEASWGAPAKLYLGFLGAFAMRLEKP